MDRRIERLDRHTDVTKKHYLLGLGGGKNNSQQ